MGERTAPVVPDAGAPLTTCGGCGYEMDGLLGAGVTRCPECNAVYRARFASARRWGRAGMWLVASLAPAVVFGVMMFLPISSRGPAWFGVVLFCSLAYWSFVVRRLARSLALTGRWELRAGTVVGLSLAVFILNVVLGVALVSVAMVMRGS